MHDTIGTSALRNSERFPQLHRDANTIRQHALGAIARHESVGKVLFGLPADWPFFYF